MVQFQNISSGALPRARIRSEGGMHNQWSDRRKLRPRPSSQSQYQYGDSSTGRTLPVPPKIQTIISQAKPLTTPSSTPKTLAPGQEDGHKFGGALMWSGRASSLRRGRVERRSDQILQGRKFWSRWLLMLSPSTLFHFTLPVWFAACGGFAKRDNVKYFVRFVDKPRDWRHGALRHHHQRALRSCDGELLQWHLAAHRPQQAADSTAC